MNEIEINKQINKIERLIKVLNVSKEEIVEDLDTLVKIADNVSDLIILIETYYMENIE